MRPFRKGDDVVLVCKGGETNERVLSAGPTWVRIDHAGGRYAQLFGDGEHTQDGKIFHASEWPAIRARVADERVINDRFYSRMWNFLSGLTHDEVKTVADVFRAAQSRGK
jgi:hypothetical protein